MNSAITLSYMLFSDELYTHFKACILPILRAPCRLLRIAFPSANCALKLRMMLDWCIILKSRCLYDPWFVTFRRHRYVPVHRRCTFIQVVRTIARTFYSLIVRTRARVTCICIHVHNVRAGAILYFLHIFTKFYVIIFEFYRAWTEGRPKAAKTILN